MSLSNCLNLLIVTLSFSFADCLQCRNNTGQEPLVRRCSRKYPGFVIALYGESIVTGEDSYAIFTNENRSILFLSHNEPFFNRCSSFEITDEHGPKCIHGGAVLNTTYGWKNETQCFYGIFVHFVESLYRLCDQAYILRPKTYIIYYHDVNFLDPKLDEVNAGRSFEYYHRLMSFVCVLVLLYRI